MIAEIDEDGSGEIDFSEFVAVMSRKVQADYTSSQVNAAFRVFEGTAPPGHIKQTDLIKALTTYGSSRLTEEQAKELVAQLEPDSSGLIAYAEFVSIMMGDSHASEDSSRPSAAAASAAGASR
jgi:calmodulin